MADLAWFLNDAARFAFERLAGVQHAFFTSSLEYLAGQWVYVLTLVIVVPAIGSRAVKITFVDDAAEMARVEVTEAVLDPASPRWSPHRWRPNGELCMWYPGDPPALRWVPSDGLPALLACIRTHLVREAWWRETGEWVGDQAPHEDTSKAVTQ